MNKKYRDVLVLLVLFTVCLTLLLPAGSLAAAVKVAPGVSDVPASFINDLKQEYGSADVVVTILEWGLRPGRILGDEKLMGDEAELAKAAGNEADSSIVIQSNTYSYYDVIKTTKETDVLEKSAFICSVAKGIQNATLVTTFKESISGSASGGIPIAMLGITATLEYTVCPERIFYGPDEDSPYNSREFRVMFYVDNGSYSATRTRATLPQAVDYFIGNWTDPSCWCSYSVDRLIE